MLSMAFSKIFAHKKSLFTIGICISFVNLIFFYYPFFQYVFKNININSFIGLWLVFSLFILSIVLNWLVFYTLLQITKVVGKIIISMLFIINALALYFIHTYHVILDESMIGNVVNTNWEESTSYFSIKQLLFILFFGIVPSIIIFKIKTETDHYKKFLKRVGISIGIIISVLLLNTQNILWIDNHSKYLGGLAMPWNYVVNLNLYFKHQNKLNEKEILLPDLEIKNTEKSVVVLVIGESARKANFSLYGYSRSTNPLLKKQNNLFLLDAESFSTYTTASVKSILDHRNMNELHEILPNYLYRNGVDVIWKTTNWGEPPLHISKVQRKNQLTAGCKTPECFLDEILLTNLKSDIESSNKDKILIVLHTSTSHGPSYYEKYPENMEVFTPVCKSVELANCTKQELINAYDNTILYTDYLLNEIIETLKSMPSHQSTMIYVSDHGESLGEKNLFMHGLPMNFAPKEQYEIPFLIWVSNENKKLKNIKKVGQNYVFHSVMHFLSLESPIYNEDLNLYQSSK